MTYAPNTTLPGGAPGPNDVSWLLNRYSQAATWENQKLTFTRTYFDPTRGFLAASRRYARIAASISRSTVTSSASRTSIESSPRRSGGRRRARHYLTGLRQTCSSIFEIFGLKAEARD